MAWMALDDFCGQPLWDYNLTWNTTYPEFTTCFESTLLVWTPCVLLLVLTPLEIFFLKKSTARKLPWTGMNIAKMAIVIALGVLCCVNMLEEWFNRRWDPLLPAKMTAEAVKVLTFILAIVLMGCNRRKGLRTSSVLFLFWTALALCEIVKYRSTFLQLIREIQAPDDVSFVSEMMYFPLLISEWVLSCFADKKRKYNLFKSEKVCPEQTASFLSQLYFWWFNSMAILGWKKPLTIADLWQLNPEDRTENIIREFNKHWYKYQRPQSNCIHSQHEYSDVQLRDSGKVYIVKALCKTFWPYFIVGVFGKFTYDILQFVSPFILRLLIGYVVSDDPLWKGMMYAFLIFGNGCVQSLLLGNYFHRMFVLGMRVRTAVVSAIYQKSLVLSSKARRESTVGEIVNLMSVDSQRFMDLMTYLNMLWSAPFQIILAMIFLWDILGPSVLAGLFLMIILIPTNALIASHAKKSQMKQMKHKDERVKVVNEVLSGIKVLKLYAWEEAFQEKVFGVRDKEINELKKMSYLNSVSILIWNCSPFLVSLATFATYVLLDEKNVLDATKAFVSLSLFNILRFPLTMLPHLITTMIMVSVSVKRINRFLGGEELSKYVIHDTTQDASLVVKNGSFSWGRSEKPVLFDINLTVPKGGLIAIVGQVGAGKSSLISSILGDMEKRKGSVSINGSIAVVTQQPWIQNASLKGNILFSHPFENTKYRHVLETCGLLPDLAVLPGGDQTEIGEKGINLSGGQKQRVSLARAVYSDADIYLLDDPLSAVDSHVGRHIFDKVIGPQGSLKLKTRILVTHGLTYLPQVDVIAVIKEGSIAEIGSFQQLVEKKGPFSEFLAHYLQEVEATEEDLEILEDIESKNPELLRSISSTSNGSGYCSSSEQRRQSILSVNRKVSIASSLGKSETMNLKNRDAQHQSKLIGKEFAETGEVKFSVYLEYLRFVGWGWVSIILVSFIIWQVLSVSSNVWLSEWGNDPPCPNGTQDTDLRNLRLGVYSALGGSQALSIFVGSFTIAFGTLLAANTLHRHLLQNVLKSPMSFFDTTPQGRIMNRFSKDVDTVDVTIPLTIRTWLSCLLQVVSTLVVISIQTPIFLSVVLPIGILYYLIQRFYVSTSRQLKRLESITRSPIYSHFSETLAGTSTIRSFGAEDRFCRQSNSLVDENQVCYYPSIVSNRWLAIRLDFCGNCIILFAALFAVLGRESLDPGKVGLSISYALMVTATLNWLVRMSSELETNIVAIERVLEYTKTPSEAEWKLPNSKLKEGWPQYGKVQLKQYSTRYRGGLDLVLRDINCTIIPGEKVGIVGRTGAGKSSLTLSLFRLIEAAGGSIIIDGVDISAIGLHDLRSKITIIPQDPVLFSGTLRMNLDPFLWYSDEQIWGALDHAHLKLFVSSLPQGLQNEVVEGGENLSVGQRQLVCLARALLRKTKILVLDEATAAVDLETDDLIQTTIRKEFSQSTVLTIAHRLNTVMDYDRIIVLDNGKIAEFDSPTVLLNNRNSVFFGMARDAGLV